MEHYNPIELEPLRVIERVALRAAPGRSLAYGVIHVLKALELIGSKVGVGRQQLARELGIGEGSARTLIKRLREEDLIEVRRDGMALTTCGEGLLSYFTGLMRSMKVPPTPSTVSEKNHAVLVRGAAALIRLGVEQRDAALLAGARGATTLIYDGERFHMPGVERGVEPELSRLLLEGLRPEAGDVVIIGTAEEERAAEMGAKAAALELIKEMGLNPPSSHPPQVG